jgi:hypothetical protein
MAGEYVLDCLRPHPSNTILPEGSLFTYFRLIDFYSCLFFYDILLGTKTMQCRMIGRDVNGELKWIWKQAVAAYFWGFSWRDWGKLQKRQSGYPVSGPTFEPGPPEYQAGVLTTRPQRSVGAFNNRKKESCYFRHVRRCVCMWPAPT